MASKYVDSNAIIQVIGCIYNAPYLLEQEDKYRITEEDFPDTFHQIVFGTIYRLHELGAKEINLLSVEDYLSGRPKSESIYKQYKGGEWLLKASENSALSTFDYYYNRLKKMTLLRLYDSVGVDVSDIYDPDNILDAKKLQQQEEYLDNFSLLDIADKISAKIDNIRTQFVDETYGRSSQAGEGIYDLIESLKETPEFGVPLYGDYMNTITRGARLGKFYLRSGASGQGKAIPNDTLIPTPEGWRRVGDIRPGDKLFGRDGKETTVLRIYPQREKKQVWKVFFQSGRIAECCNEHLWSFYSTPHSHKLYTKTLKDIYEESKQNNFKRFSHYCYRVPIAEPVELPEKSYSIEPYVFGLLLGDGSFRYGETNKALMFSSEDNILPKEIAKRLNFNLKRHSSNKYCWYFEHKNKSIKHLNVWVEELLKDYPELWNCNSHTKFIPQEYLFGSIEQRIELLRGLMDTDGGFTLSNGTTSYTTVSPQLKDDFMGLLASLGMRFHLYEEHKPDNRIAFHINILIDNDKKEQLFHLERKKQLAKEFVQTHPFKQRGDRKTDPIVKIEPLDEKASMTCFTVDNKEHLFIAGATWWISHNTRAMAADAAYIACNEIYYSNIGWVSTGEMRPVSFITTELTLDEVQTLFLCFLSGVNEEHILNGKYIGDEEERVLHAAEVLAKAPLYVEEMMDFSLQDVENVVKKNIREHNVRYICLDYIHSSLKILEEISTKTKGMKLREDNVLFMMSNKLKNICNQYNVFIMSATQLSGDYRDSDTPDQSLLRGAKSLADKIDTGMILLPVNEKDLDGLSDIINRGCYQIPDMKLSVYKNRRGKYKGVYLWCQSDLGTCRINPMFATTWNYEFVKIENIILEG